MLNGACLFHTSKFSGDSDFLTYFTLSDFKDSPFELTVDLDTPKPVAIRMAIPDEKDLIAVRGRDPNAKFPETLEQVVDWWDNVQKRPYELWRPIQVAPQASFLDVRSNVFRFAKTRSTFKQSNTNNIAKRTLSASPSVSFNPGSEGLHLKAPDDGLPTLFIPIVTYSVVTVRQDDTKAMFPQWRRGAFSTSFPDLYLSAKGLEFLNLDDLGKHIDEQMRNEEVFEAFGLKIPAQQVTSWGTLLIVSIQLYLYLYLRDLKRPVRQSDPGWEVGWIGMNASLLARSLFLVTVFLLPTIAVSLLSIHAIDQLAHQLGISWGWGLLTLRLGSVSCASPGPAFFISLAPY
jgi:hypothetical protein